jgi:antitoxin component YwqK of YwqJK toxin-antitoxin module
MKKLITIAFFLCATAYAHAQYSHVQVGSNGNKIEEGQYNADPGIQAGDSKETIATKMASIHKIGVWKYWYENGQMSAEEHYDNAGTRIGLWKTWHYNAQLSAQIDYTGGKVTMYHPNGQKSEEGSMNTNNERTGTWQGWHENGNINYKGSFDSKGLKTGTWEYFDSNGKPFATQVFQNGELVR